MPGAGSARQPVAPRPGALPDGQIPVVLKRLYAHCATVEGCLLACTAHIPSLHQHLAAGLHQQGDSQEYVNLLRHSYVCSTEPPVQMPQSLTAHQSCSQTEVRAQRRVLRVWPCRG